MLANNLRQADASKNNAPRSVNERQLMQHFQNNWHRAAMKMRATVPR